MKILVIGASDSAGTSLPDPAQSWRATLERELPPLLGESVEIPHVRFYTYVPGAQEYIAQHVNEHRPDVTIVAATAYGFAYRTVGGRFIRLLGWTAGRWLERHIEAWDAAVAHANCPIWRVHDFARRTVHGTIGTAPYSTLADTLGGYEQLVGKLLQDERMRVVLMGATHPGEVVARVRNANAAIDRFNVALASLAESRHCEWLDRQRLLEKLDPLGHGLLQRDGVHRTAAYHRHLASALNGLVSNWPT
jgi:hypothetical protein